MLLIDADEVTRLLDMNACIDAVEKAFRSRGEGRLATSSVAGLELNGGSLHAKLGVLELSRVYSAAKVNANFPENPGKRGLPTIQGMLVLFDGSSGLPLACMDSAPITATRTAAASAVAARYLALAGASSVAFIGCGTQARAHASALACVRPIESAVLFDEDSRAAEGFAAELRARHLKVEIVRSARTAARAGRIIVTSTPSRRPLLDVDDLQHGSFVAAVGADNEHKQEIAPALLRTAVVIVDDLEQCARIGDLHHALDLGVMRRKDVRGSLDQVVAGKVTGRNSDDEIIIFDSTGVAIEDVAAAALVYERAMDAGAGLSSGRSSNSPSPGTH